MPTKSPKKSSTSPYNRRRRRTFDDDSDFDVIPDKYRETVYDLIDRKVAERVQEGMIELKEKFKKELHDHEDAQEFEMARIEHDYKYGYHHASLHHGY